MEKKLYSSFTIIRVKKNVHTNHHQKTAFSFLHSDPPPPPDKNQFFSVKFILIENQKRIRVHRNIARSRASKMEGGDPEFRPQKKSIMQYVFGF